MDKFIKRPSINKDKKENTLYISFRVHTEKNGGKSVIFGEDNSFYS